MTDDCHPPRHRVSYSARLASAELQHGGQLGQFRLMLVRVVLAEEKLSSGRQLGAYASCGTAAVAAVSSGMVRVAFMASPFSCIHSLRRMGFLRCSPIVIGCVVSHAFLTTFREAR